MSSSDAQPPLSRRQARERERAAAAGGQPVTPPPTVAAPAEQPESRRRPGSHVAPAPAAPAQSARPAAATTPAAAAATSASAATPAPAPVGVPSAPPASATEIVPGTGGLTRRQIRLMREAEGNSVRPVPLQAPTPQSSDRTVQDVIGSVDDLDTARAGAATTQAPGGWATQSSTPAQQSAPAQSNAAAPTSVPSPTSAPARSSAPTTAEQPQPEPLDQVVEPMPVEPETVVLDQAAVAQATEADGSPDAIEPLEEAAAHAEEPRRHRSTWAPHDAEQPEPEAPAVPAAASSIVPSSEAGVFPLSLDDDDTNEVPVQPAAGSTQGAATTPRGADAADDAPRVPAAFQRPVEPKPVTTAFEPPAGHWSQQAHDSNDAEVHDEETGTRRVAVTNTNAIILPNSALADPTGALNATGEVILTGSIDLPASLSSTGSHRPIDGAEVDRLLEQHDEQPETDASPVRASRAVSSHTSTRQVVLAAAKPKESKTPVILGVTVGAVGLAAAAVIIVALVTTHIGG